MAQLRGVGIWGARGDSPPPQILVEIGAKIFLKWVHPIIFLSNVFHTSYLIQKQQLLILYTLLNQMRDVKNIRRKDDNLPLINCLLLLLSLLLQIFRPSYGPAVIHKNGPKKCNSLVVEILHQFSRWANSAINNSSFFWGKSVAKCNSLS